MDQKQKAELMGKIRTVQCETYAKSKPRSVSDCRIKKMIVDRPGTVSDADMAFFVQFNACKYYEPKDVR